MSGIFARQHYDDCYSNEFVHQQTNPGLYRMFELYGESPAKCYSEFGPSANAKRNTGELPTGDHVKRVELEGYLMNLDIPNSKCIDPNTMMAKNNRLKEVTKNDNYSRNLCHDNLNYKYSRLDIPTNDLRSVYINRYDFPIVEPQNNIYYGMNGTEQTGDSRFGVNTKLKLKDSIRRNQ